jgi:hypothetical protein
MVDGAAVEGGIPYHGAASASLRRMEELVALRLLGWLATALSCDDNSKSRANGVTGGDESDDAEYYSCSILEGLPVRRTKDISNGTGHNNWKPLTARFTTCGAALLLATAGICTLVATLCMLSCGTAFSLLSTTLLSPYLPACLLF